MISLYFIFGLFFLYLFFCLKTNLKLTQITLFLFLFFLETMLLAENFATVFYIYVDLCLMTLTVIIFFEVVYNERE